MAETIESPLITVSGAQGWPRCGPARRPNYRKVQVPFESLKRAAKEKKSSLDEVSSVVKMLDVSSTVAMTAAEQLDLLSKMAIRLQSLKRKVEVFF